MVEPVITKFCVIYDGEDHANHEMNIMTLGRSLSALGNILYEANEIINGDRKSINIKVEANFIRGSFGFTTEFVQLAPHAKDILSVLGFMGATAGAVTVASVIDWLNGEDITMISSKNSKIETIQVGQESIDCPKDVALLVTNPTIRKALDEMIRGPLLNKGTGSIAIKKAPDASPSFFIDKSGAKAFVRLAVEENTKNKDKEAIVKFIAANIKKKTGWKIELDGKEVTASMNDELFLERLLNMEEPHVFGKKFNVKLRVTTKKTYDTTRESYIIKQVHHESRS